MVQTLKPNANPTPQDWHAYPGGRSWQKVNEGTGSHDGDTGYIYADGDGHVVALPLEIGDDPHVHDRHVLRITHRRYKTAGTASISGTTAVLSSDGTDVATFELSPPTGDWVTDEYELTPAEAAAITHYGALTVTITSGTFALGAEPGIYAEHRITAVELEVPAVGSAEASGTATLAGSALAVVIGVAAGVASLAGTATAQPWSQATGTATLAGTATASISGSSPVFTPKVGYDWIPFCSVSSGVPDHQVLRCAYFEGVGTAPPAGRAAIAVPLIESMRFTRQPTEINADDDPLYHTYLMAGFGVWLVSMPPARGDSPLSPVSSATFDLDANPQELGPAYTGNGVTYPAQASLSPAWIATPPPRDPEWLMAWKTFAMFTQWLADGNGEAAGCDMSKMAGRGGSAGGDTLLHVAWAPNLAPQMFPGGTGQDAISTRGVYKALACYITPTWSDIFSLSVSYPRWPDNAPPGDVPAPTLGDADPAIVTQDSALYYGTLSLVNSSNAQLPCYMAYRKASLTGPPYEKANVSHLDVDPHVDWSGRAAKNYFPDAVRLVAYTTACYDAAYYDELVDTDLLGMQAGYDHEVAWMAETLGWDAGLAPTASGTATLYGTATGALTGPGFYERVANIIRAMVGTHVATALGLTVDYDNAPASEPTDTLRVRAAIEYEGADQLDFGGASRPTVRARGALRLDFRAPLEMGEEAAVQAADAARAAFRFNVASPPVIFRAASLEGPSRDAAGWVVTVRIPFHADDVASAVAATPGSTGNTVTFEQMTDLLRARFGTYIETALSVPVQYDNEGQAPVEGARWVRLTLLSGEHAAVGRGTGKTEVRVTGTVVAQVFVPAEMGDQQGWEVVDAIHEQFRQVATGAVVLRTPSVRVVGRDADGPWWQINVSCPFVAVGA